MLSRQLAKCARPRSCSAWVSGSQRAMPLDSNRAMHGARSILHALKWISWPDAPSFTAFAPRHGPSRRSARAPKLLLILPRPCRYAGPGHSTGLACRSRAAVVGGNIAYESLCGGRGHVHYGRQIEHGGGEFGHRSGRVTGHHDGLFDQQPRDRPGDLEQSHNPRRRQ